jgi:hypothetical protein
MDENLQASYEEHFHAAFRKVDDYFKSKEDYLSKYKNSSFIESLKDAPKHFALINFVEKFNVFLNKDKKWLQHFTEKNKIKFDFQLYEKWKVEKNFNENKFSYNSTQCPSKWIYAVQDYFIELLESLQVLLVLEFYISTEEFKKFLNENPKIFLRMKANYMKSSPPSENIDLIFTVIDYLLVLNKEHNFLVNPVIDTVLCMNVYRRIDSLKIFDLLKQKEFFIKFRLDFLKITSSQSRRKIPYESNVVEIGDNFLKIYGDLFRTYNEYKKRLIEKHSSSKY